MRLKTSNALNLRSGLKMKSEKDKTERAASGLQTISLTLQPLAKKVLGKNGFVEIDIITNWNKIVGEKTAKFVHPQSINFKKGQRENGVLVLDTCSGAFAVEISHKKNIIIEKVNTYFGYGAVSDIRVLQTGYADFEKPNKSSFTGGNKTLVTTEEQNYIKEQTAGVQHEELRCVLQKLGENIFKRNGKKDDF